MKALTALTDFEHGLLPQQRRPLGWVPQIWPQKCSAVLASNPWIAQS